MLMISKVCGRCPANPPPSDHGRGRSRSWLGAHGLPRPTLKTSSTMTLTMVFAWFGGHTIGSADFDPDSAGHVIGLGGSSPLP
jgi:hypothetical protein